MNLRNAKAEKLNGLGVALVAKLLGATSTRWQTKDKDGKSVRVKVQNRFHSEKLGDCFTINPDAKGAVEVVNSDTRLIFVDYDDPKVIRVYECVDHASYEMQYVGGTSFSGNRRIAMCFPLSKMILVGEVVEPETLSQMKSLSNARKFDIESTHYARR